MSELELAYNSVEVKASHAQYQTCLFPSDTYWHVHARAQEQCTETEAAVQAQNEEMMALVMEQYNDMSVSMEEEKKAKLEQIYDQIVSVQENVDSAKTTLETTAREAETEARVSAIDPNCRDLFLPWSLLKSLLPSDTWRHSFKVTVQRIHSKKVLLRS